MSLISDILPVENIILDLDVSSKKRVFEQVGLLIENHLGIARSEVFECLFSREKLGSTGLGQGVAIPHGRSPGLKTATGVFVRVKEAIAFDAPDGKPVWAMFILLVPEEATDLHLQVLSELAQKFSVKSIRERLQVAETNQAIHDIFAE